MARPSKLSKSVIEKIIRAIHMGCFIDTAAASAGIGRSTFHEWLRRGEDDIKNKKRTLASDLKVQYDAASATAEHRMLEIIDKAAKNDWKAAAWKLERKWPDRWARRQVLSVTRDDGIMSSTLLDLDNLTDGELRTLRELVKKGAKHKKRIKEKDIDKVLN